MILDAVVRNIRVRAWGLWLPSMAATTFYVEDAAYYQGSGHFSKSPQPLLQLDPDMVESSCHAIIIVILLVFKLWSFSVRKRERSLLDSTYKVLCQRNVLFLFRELSGLLILVVLPCWVLAGQLLYHPSLPSPHPFPEEGHRWVCFECRCAWKYCQGTTVFKVTQENEKWDRIAVPTYLGCTKIGEEALSIREKCNIRLHFQIKVCYMYMYLLHVFGKHSNTSCVL